MAAAEQKKSYQVVKQFKGLNTKANRTAIEEDEFSWIENAQPVGYANIKIVPTYSQVSNSSNVAVTWTNTVSQLASVNIGLNDYIIAFLTDGSAQYFNIQTAVTGNVAVAGTFSNAGISYSQWYNDRMLILDPSKGLSSWDGNNVISIGSVGVVAITNNGSGYTTAPTVTISAPNQTGGVQANATASLTSGANTCLLYTSPSPRD